MPTKTILAIVLLGAIIGGGWYWKSAQTDEVTYQTALVTKGELTQAVTATGTLNPVVNVQVGSQISGNIEKLFVDYNSPVKEGQVVAQIDPAMYRATVMQAEGDLANANAALELARTNAKRAQELRKENAAPQSTLDTAMAALHQAEATVQVKEGSLARAKVDLDHCTIYSPIDGIVISRSVDVGQTVAASLSAPVIFTIANDPSENADRLECRGSGRGKRRGGPERRFHGGRVSVSDLSRDGGAGPQRADHRAERGDVRHGDRRQQ